MSADKTNSIRGMWRVTRPSPDEMDCESGGSANCDIKGFLEQK